MKKQATLFLNGTFSKSDCLPFEPSKEDLIVCADGGVRHAFQSGRIPDLVIGDFDSIHEEELKLLKEKEVELLRFPADKDETDMELAMEYLSQKGYGSVTLYAVLGGRIDHELANLTVAVAFARKGVEVRFVANRLAGYVLHGPACLKLQGQIGETLSIIVVSPRAEGVNINGLKWPLKDAELSFGSARTLSNRFDEKSAQISLACGDLLVMHHCIQREAKG